MHYMYKVKHGGWGGGRFIHLLQTLTISFSHETLIRTPFFQVLFFFKYKVLQFIFMKNNCLYFLVYILLDKVDINLNSSIAFIL